MRRAIPCLALACLAPWSAAAATYEVGPGQPLAAVGDVPWESLQAGDTVRIHWRAEPYREKFVLCVRGTAERPVVVQGVRGPNGERPVLDGRDATTRAALNYWNEARGVIKVGGANTPADTLPAHVRIEGLEVRSARPPYTFTGRDGLTAYPNNAAAIFVEKAEQLVIRDCELHDSGNGLFVAVSDGATRDVRVEGNFLHGNGNEGSAYEHNSYTEALGILFEGNRYGPLRAGCAGNNLKDRSAGLVVRWNWLEGGNRQLDLVDAEGSQVLVQDPRYRETFVYGNVLLEPGDDGDSQIVHYGGDSGTEADYRKGTLHFFHNTVVSRRSGNTTLFRLSTNEEQADCRHNIVLVTQAGSRLALLDGDGQLSLGHNFFKPGRVDSHSGLSGSIQDDGTSILAAEPGFLDEAGDDFHLAAGSVCLDQAGPLAPAATGHPLHSQYLAHQGLEPRPADGPLDLGAFERCQSGACADPADGGDGGGDDGEPGEDDAGPGEDDAGPGEDEGQGGSGNLSGSCACGHAAGGSAWLWLLVALGGWVRRVTCARTG